MLSASSPTVPSLVRETDVMLWARSAIHAVFIQRDFIPPGRLSREHCSHASRQPRIDGSRHSVSLHRKNSYRLAEATTVGEVNIIITRDRETWAGRSAMDRQTENNKQTDTKQPRDTKRRKSTTIFDTPCYLLGFTHLEHLLYELQHLDKTPSDPAMKYQQLHLTGISSFGDLGNERKCSLITSRESRRTSL